MDITNEREASGAWWKSSVSVIVAKSEIGEERNEEVRYVGRR